MLQGSYPIGVTQLLHKAIRKSRKSAAFNKVWKLTSKLLHNGVYLKICAISKAKSVQLCCCSKLSLKRKESVFLKAAHSVNPR
jgi:hypothetical protein